MKGEEKRHIAEKAEKILDFMTIIGRKEAAEILGITETHLMRLSRNKGLPHYKPNRGKVYFIKEEVIKWLTGKTEESV